ncbi:ABC transporter ATP-binding protein [candidate division KSB1 bacterium]
MSIKIENITFFYNETEILREISFCIPKGEIWALLGRSGIGKTTLINIISGLFTPKTGKILINNREYGPGCIKGIVFQDESLLGWLTVKQNLLFPDYKKPNKGRELNVKQILESVQLTEACNLLPYQLSAGMKKRLEFARALDADPEYILADEPFGTLDIITRRSLWSLWKNLKRENPRTGILCTHDPDEAIRLSDQIILMKPIDVSDQTLLYKIPDSIKCLDINLENDDLRILRQKIISNL